MRIRKYKESDRVQVEKLHFENGFLGRSMSVLLSNDFLWKRSIKYYLEKEPESIFVLDNKGVVLGYILGCLDDKSYKKNTRVVLSVFKYFFWSFFFSKQDVKFWKSRLLIVFNTLFGLSDEIRFKVPKGAGHFHINLTKRVRGNNFGSELLKRFEEYAKDSGVGVLHADGFEARVNPNTNFWFKNGFSVYSKVKTSTWKEQLPGEKINLVCYYKVLMD